MTQIQSLIKHLDLQPHPEGGFFKETYRSNAVFQPNDEFYSGAATRNYSTAIYFLLTKGNFSAFHRIKADEVWHFYQGDTLLVHCISPEGKYYTLSVGPQISATTQPQAVVPAGTWFASEVISTGEFALVGCTVSPGFDFQDFELANREALVEEFPQHAAIITRLTRV